MKKIHKILFIAAGLLLAVNVVLTSLIVTKPAIECQCAEKKSFPCESVPIRWAVRHYDCANSLLLAMNVTNVKFNPPGTVDALIRNRTASIS